MVPQEKVFLCRLRPLTSQLGNLTASSVKQLSSHPTTRTNLSLAQAPTMEWKAFFFPLSSWCFWLIQFGRVRSGKEIHVLYDTVVIYSCVAGILCDRHSELHKHRLSDHRRICALTVHHIISYCLDLLMSSVHFQDSSQVLLFTVHTWP